MCVICTFAMDLHSNLHLSYKMRYLIEAHVVFLSAHQYLYYIILLYVNVINVR